MGSSLFGLVPAEAKPEKNNPTHHRMLIHNALFWLKADLSSEQRATFDAEVRKLASIPYLLRGFAGKPAATEKREVTDHSFDCATSLHFKSLADHEHYQKYCAVHANFVKTCRGFWEKVIVYDMTPETEE